MQGLIAGGTSYEDQSLEDILKDIIIWVNYTEEIISEMEEGIIKLKKSKFWDEVYCDFKLTLMSSLRCQRSYLHDFSIIIKAIQEDKITEREVGLLRKIGEKSSEFNHEYGKTFKEESRWREYGNPDFTVAEDLYSEGRGFFITLQDAVNASARLKDYINSSFNITSNTINQNISGNKNIISGVNYGKVTYDAINKENLSKEIKEAISRIDKLDEYNEDIRNFVYQTLMETLEAVKKENIEKQKSSKISLASFLTGLGKNADVIINTLASLTTIASFFGIKGL